MQSYISALERQDLKNYPTEIEKIPQRDPGKSPPIGERVIYADIAAELEEAEPGDGVSSEAAGGGADRTLRLWEAESFGLRDILDIINPLQHIPIVATFYRKMTGDAIGPASRVIGGALWGRIGGFVSGVINAVAAIVTGKDVGDHIYAALFGESDGSNQGTALAKAVSVPARSPSKDAASVKSATINVPADFVDSRPRPYFENSTITEENLEPGWAFRTYKENPDRSGTSDLRPARKKTTAETKAQTPQVLPHLFGPSNPYREMNSQGRTGPGVAPTNTRFLEEASRYAPRAGNERANSDLHATLWKPWILAASLAAMSKYENMSDADGRKRLRGVQYVA